MTEHQTSAQPPAAPASSPPHAAAPLTVGWHAERTPDKPAIVMGTSGEVVTYGQLEDRSACFARALRDRGLTEGDHVAILMENNRPYLEVAWAAQRSGLRYTAVNSHLTPPEVQYILDDSGADVLVSSAAMAEVVAGLDVSRCRIRVCAVGDLDGFERYDRVLAATAGGPLDDEREGREMLYSSGTTGRPKGVRKKLPEAPLGDPTSEPVQIAQGVHLRGIGEDAVYLSPAPLYHSAPLVFCLSIMRLGATIVVMEGFDPRRCLELIERYRVTDAQMVPTMFVRMLRLPDEERTGYDVSSLRYVVHAAAPCPVPVKRSMIEWWGPIIHEYYAGTEDIGTTAITSEEWLTHPGSVGRPRDECHIVGEDGEELPVGEAGIVYFVGGRPFEYHNDPEKTADVSNEKGWRTLGDIGFLDEDGFLYLTDRQAHMIIAGGVNIYPQEAENVLAAHVEVADVAVIGIPNPDLGEEVKAVVQLVDPAAAGTEERAAAKEQLLLDYCRANLSTYKCPRSVDFVEALPRDDNGKLYKRRLRDAYWAGHESHVI